ncbi:ABC transporter ATP-binding protein [Microbacterium sp. PMB16]|uniref:ABC transporter ATP-binding protein n=1 Tax=Microbacterium sp. PMB16 TaxID=3120157 RepID=UPI003F4B5757
MSDAPVLSVKGLRKVYSVARPGSLRRGSFVALDALDLEVPVGGSMAIVGESGSGKSTCARLIVGLEKPDAGTIFVQGREWRAGRLSSQQRRERARSVQMVFQDPYLSLDRRQSVGDALAETIRLVSSRSRSQVAERVRELMDRVGLSPQYLDSVPRSLSGGQRQRVAIARALAAEPALLILDEAVAALDVSIQAQVLNLLNEIRRDSHVAFLFISHDLAVVEQVCDDVIVMRDGLMVESGPVERVLHDPQDAYTRNLLASVPQRGWRPQRRSVASTTTTTLLRVVSQERKF